MILNEDFFNDVEDMSSEYGHEYPLHIDIIYCGIDSAPHIITEKRFEYLLDMQNNVEGSKVRYEFDKQNKTFRINIDMFASFKCFMDIFNVLKAIAEVTRICEGISVFAINNKPIKMYFLVQEYFEKMFDNFKVDDYEDYHYLVEEVGDFEYVVAAIKEISDILGIRLTEKDIMVNMPYIADLEARDTLIAWISDNYELFAYSGKVKAVSDYAFINKYMLKELFDADDVDVYILTRHDYSPLIERCLLVNHMKRSDLDNFGGLKDAYDKICSYRWPIYPRMTRYGHINKRKLSCAKICFGYIEGDETRTCCLMIKGKTDAVDEWVDKIFIKKNR